jgi:signal transduction histidine kinase
MPTSMQSSSAALEAGPPRELNAATPGALCAGEVLRLLRTVSQILDRPVLSVTDLDHVSEVTGNVLKARCSLELLDTAHAHGGGEGTGSASEAAQGSAAVSRPTLLDPLWLARVIARPVVLGGVEDEPLLARSFGAGTAAAMVVPIIGGGSVLGKLTAVSSQPGRCFSEEEVALAEQVGRQFAAAIRHERLRVEANEARQTKSAFLALMSHELRTPLSTIIGYAELLLMGIPEPLAETPRSHVNHMRASAWHLLRLIEEILAFSRLESGREELHPEPIRVSEVIEHAVGLVAPAASEKGLMLRVAAAAPLPPLVTDSSKLSRILLHLLTNAVRFTEAGEVTLEVATEAERIIFRVHDTGIGVPLSRQEQVFIPFWQGEPEDTRRYGGTGIGLSVARALAHLMGGELTLSSVEGAGSIFTLSLPLVPPKPHNRRH